MSSISSTNSPLAGFQNPQVSGQGPGAKPAQNQSDSTADVAKATTPTDTAETSGAKDAATAALVQPDLTKDEARSLSADVGKQLGGQSLSIANRAPQALQSAFGG
jgi:hypothetical protein